MDTTDNKPFSLKDDFPLHYLAKSENSEELEKYLFSHPTDALRHLLRFDFKGRTVIHYASLAVNLTDGEKCVESILKFLTELDGHEKEVFTNWARHNVGTRREGIEDATIKFINIRDVEDMTSIHLAALNENAKIVEILLNHSANVLLPVEDSRKLGVLRTLKRKEGTLGLIYSNTPSAVTSLLNKSVSFDYGVETDNFTKIERSYCLDFKAVIGGTTDYVDDKGREMVYKESLFLSSVNDKEIEIRKEILKHPLVRFFVSKKISKFQWIIFTSLFLHLLWLILYIWHVVEVYYNCCELESIYSKVTSAQAVYCSAYPFDQLSINWTETDQILAFETVVNCTQENNNLGRCLPIIFLTVLIMLSNIFKIAFLRRDYFKKLQNLFLWFFSICVLLTAFPSATAFKWQFQLTSFTILVATLLILELVNKHVYWAIYIRVLIKVMKRFLAICPLFLFIMLAFSTSLRMLFPDKNPAVKEFRNAMMEVFATIANGKVEWIDGHGYKTSMDNNFRFSGFLMFIFFYVTMILLLFRILIGFVVADTKKIQEEEELNEISRDLEEIFLLESFLVSRGFQWLSSFESLSFLKNLRIKFMLCPHSKLELWISESEIPKYLRKEMRIIASKNPVKSTRQSHDNNNQRHTTL